MKLEGQLEVPGADCSQILQYLAIFRPGLCVDFRLGLLAPDDPSHKRYGVHQCRAPLTDGLRALYFLSPPRALTPPSSRDAAS